MEACDGCGNPAEMCVCNPRIAELENLLVIAVTEHADDCKCDACEWANKHINDRIAKMRNREGRI